MREDYLSRLTGLHVRILLGKGVYHVIGESDDGRRTIHVKSASKKGAISQFMRENWAQVTRMVAERQSMKCAFCGRVAPLQFHHIVPRSRGRRDTPENIVGICGAFGCRAHARIHGQCS